MIYLIILLIIINLVSIIYLFFYKRDLKRISYEIKTINQIDTNMLVHKKVEDKDLNLLIAEINDLVRDIKQKKISIEIKNESMQKMIANIAHDLRTPLTSALGYIELIEDNELSKNEEEKYLKIICDRLKRLSYLTNSFFELSKIIYNRENIEKENINAIDILEESIANYYEDFSNEKRKIIFEKSNPKIMISTNKMMLIRIIDNLIVNALKHSNSDLTIKINDNVENVNMLFENNIEEYGIDIERIFDEFYTSDISRSKQNTGLGLAIVKEFITILGGNIKAEQIDNKLRFDIELKK